MSASTRTTIVVISHDYGRYLRQAVSSALAQTRRVPVLVMDDGSTDSTPAVARELIRTYPGRVRSFRTRSAEGPARTRNAAARIVASEWIVYLDADDWLADRFVEDGETWLDAHAEVSALTTDMYVAAADRPLRMRTSGIPAVWRDLLRRNTIVQTSFIRRESILAIGGYDASLHHEDWDFWIRLLKAGHHIGRLPGPHVFWRDHGRNRSKRCDDRAACRQVRDKHEPDGCGRSRPEPLPAEAAEQRLLRLLHSTARCGRRAGRSLVARDRVR